MNTTGSPDSTGPHPALMSALTTEHYTVQSARTSIIVGANGRACCSSPHLAAPPSPWRWWRNWTTWQHVRDVCPDRAARTAGARA